MPWVLSVATVILSVARIESVDPDERERQAV